MQGLKKVGEYKTFDEAAKHRVVLKSTGKRVIIRRRKGCFQIWSQVEVIVENSSH